MAPRQLLFLKLKLAVASGAPGKRIAFIAFPQVALPPPCPQFVAQFASLCSQPPPTPIYQPDQVRTGGRGVIGALTGISAANSGPEIVSAKPIAKPNPSFRAMLTPLV